jgi:carboxylate-amine ligase
LGLGAAAAGTHPCAIWTDVEVSPMLRYRQIHASLRELARREPTCALHVHVAVPDGDAAVRALAGLRQDLPVLLALSANSPFWQGRDTGLASARTPIFSMFPRVGIPRAFGSYAGYADAVDALIRGGAIPDPSFLWWDVRLQPRLGTVEVRIMDTQTEPADAGALAGLVQCLVHRYACTGPLAEPPAVEVLDENRFLAARDGLDARLLTAGGSEPAVDRVEHLLDRCRPTARSLGCAAELEDVRRLVSRPGHARQRAAAVPHGPRGVAAHLARRFGAAQGSGVLAAAGA